MLKDDVGVACGVACGTDRGDGECIWRKESSHLESKGIDKGVILKLVLISTECNDVH